MFAYGGDGADVFYAGAGDDSLWGDAGNDWFDLYAYDRTTKLSQDPGQDAAYGGDGDDTFLVGMDRIGQVTLQGGAGQDVLALATSFATIRSKAVHLTLTAAQGIETLVVWNLDQGSSSSAFTKFADVIDAPSTLVVQGLDMAWGADSVKILGGWVEGGAGDDTLISGAGAAWLFGGDGADVIQSGTGAAYLNGGNGADLIHGGGGNDTIVMDTGDQLFGGAGTDTLLLRGYLSGDATQPAIWSPQVLPEGFERLRLEGLVLSQGDDVLDLTGLDPALLRGSGPISGGDGNDRILLGDATNLGYVRIAGGTGADTMGGGAGNTIYFVDDPGDVIVEKAGGGVDEVETSISFSLAGFGQVEKLWFIGSGDAVLTGNGLNNVLQGGDGNDRLVGGAGADTMFGNAGADVYLVDDPGDRAIETLQDGDIDLVLARTDSFVLGNTIENLTYIGTGNFRGTGNQQANRLTGGAGNDTLNGGHGADTLVGGDGDDTYILRDGIETIRELAGGGTDTLVLRGDLPAGFSLTLPSQVENLRAEVTTDVNLHGNGLDNVLRGGAGSDTLEGGQGADTLWGGAGNDLLILGGAGDRAFGGDGADLFRLQQAGAQVDGGAGYDIVQVDFAGTYALSGTVEQAFAGGAGAVRLLGNKGDNVLIGGTGDDTLIGGEGWDRLQDWSGGADRFVLRDEIAAGTFDAIEGFRSGQDQIAIDIRDGGTITGIPLGKLSASQFKAMDYYDVNLLDANDRFFYVRSEGYLVYDPDGKGGLSGWIVAWIDDPSRMGPAASDIVLI